VAEIDKTMTSSELTHWIAYDNIEPFGAIRDNIHAGIIAAMVGNPYKKGKPLSPVDFLLKDPEEQREKETAKFFNWLKASAKRKT
jgi:hypothetical protein